MPEIHFIRYLETLETTESDNELSAGLLIQLIQQGTIFGGARKVSVYRVDGIADTVLLDMILEKVGSQYAGKTRLTDLIRSPTAAAFSFMMLTKIYTLEIGICQYQKTPSPTSSRLHQGFSQIL